ncbi:diguanylate cyclase [Vibrio makurazakiensis]
MSMNGQPYFGGDSPDPEYSKIEALFIHSLSEEDNGDYVGAQQGFLKLLNNIQLKYDQDAQILFTYQLCRSLNEQSQYHSANFYCSSLADLLDSSANPAMPKYVGYRVIANNQHFRGDYSLALKTYQRLLENTPKNVDVSGAYNDIGNLLKELKQFEKSEEYLIKALKLRSSAPLLKQAQVEHSLANFYMVQGQVEKSVEHFKNVLTSLEETQHKYGLALTKLGLGKAYTQLQEYDLAQKYLVEALSSAAEFESDGIRTESYLALSDAFEAQQLLNNAFHYAYLAKDLSEKVQRNKYLSRVLLQLTDLSKLNGDYQSAHNYYMQYAEAELSSRDIDNRLAIEAIELTRSRYEQELESSALMNELRLEKLQNERMEEQRTMYNIIVFVLLLGASLSFYSNRKIKKRASYDLMTQCLNRATIINKIKAIPALEDKTTSHVLVLLDLDNFKQINDEYGHPTGDKALVQISQNIRDSLQADECIGRLGGEEFLIFLTNIEDQDIRHRVTSLHQTVSKTIFKSETHRSLTTTASFSYISTSRSLSDFDELYSILDQALYQAKKNGRNCIIDAYNEAIDLPNPTY